METPKGDDGTSRPALPLGGGTGPKKYARPLPHLREFLPLRKLCRLRYRLHLPKKSDIIMLLRNTTLPVLWCGSATAVPIVEIVKRYLLGETVI